MASTVERDPSPEALAARLEELNREIREYPQPIARCDAQLAGLVEERDRLRAQLRGAAKP